MTDATATSGHQAFEIPHRRLLLVTSPVKAVRTFWAGRLLRSPVS